VRNGLRVTLLSWLVAAGVLAGSQPSLGDDMWWVLATGREIFTSGRIPHTEIFSLSAAGHPWYHQEWLSHVLFYVVLDVLGPDGLAVFKIGLAVLIIVLLGVVAARRSGSPFLGTAAAAFAASRCVDDLDVRAKIFTVLCGVAMRGRPRRAREDLHRSVRRRDARTTSTRARRSSPFCAASR